MEAATGIDALRLAQLRARKWLRRFQHLVRVLDRLEQRGSSLFCSSFVFLIQRALGRLEHPEPMVAVAHAERESEIGGEADESQFADELLQAVELGGVVATSDRPSGRNDPASDELEVLLVLAGGLTDESGEGSFADFDVGVDALVREYRQLNHLSAEAVGRMALLPPGLQRRWALLLARASTPEDPLRRLALELSLMRVMRALYALAIGWRKAAQFGRPEGDADVWLAYTLGESTLKQVRQ